MARRTINLPDYIESDVRELAREGESFSAAVTRVLEEGIRSARGRRSPSYVGVGSGPADLSVRVEEYLREPVESR